MADFKLRLAAMLKPSKKVNPFVRPKGSAPTPSEVLRSKMPVEQAAQGDRTVAPQERS